MFFNRAKNHVLYWLFITNMKNKLKYIQYLLRHKWYVMLECFKFGLIWRGLVHDLSKFFPSEFPYYANFFYGKNSKFQCKKGHKNGYCKPVDTGDQEFDFAWLLHLKRNRHHWQWWVIPNDTNGVKILPIQEPYLTEMLCDWVAANKAQGRFSPKDDPYKNVREWYVEHKGKIQLAKETREEIEKRISLTL